MTDIEKAARAIAADMNATEGDFNVFPDDYISHARACISSLIPVSEEVVSVMVQAWHDKGVALLDEQCAAVLEAAINHFLAQGEKL